MEYVLKMEEEEFFVLDDLIRAHGQGWLDRVLPEHVQAAKSLFAKIWELRPE